MISKHGNTVILLQLLPLLLLAISGVTAFQPIIFQTTQGTQRNSIPTTSNKHKYTRPLYLSSPPPGGEESKSESESETSSSSLETETTEASSPSAQQKEEKLPVSESEYQIAKDYQRTGLPEDSNASNNKGPNIDFFTVGLGLYVVFVIVDTFVVKITPEENYSTALINGIRGLLGAGGSGGGEGAQ